MLRLITLQLPNTTWVIDVAFFPPSKGVKKRTKCEWVHRVQCASKFVFLLYITTKSVTIWTLFPVKFAHSQKRTKINIAFFQWKVVTKSILQQTPAINSYFQCKEQPQYSKMNKLSLWIWWNWKDPVKLNGKRYKWKGIPFNSSSNIASRVQIKCVNVHQWRQWSTSDKDTCTILTGQRRRGRIIKVITNVHLPLAK